MLLSAGRLPKQSRQVHAPASAETRELNRAAFDRAGWQSRPPILLLRDTPLRSPAGPTCDLSAMLRVLHRSCSGAPENDAAPMFRADRERSWNRKVAARRQTGSW